MLSRPCLGRLITTVIVGNSPVGLAMAERVKGVNLKAVQEEKRNIYAVKYYSQWLCSIKPLQTLTWQILNLCSQGKYKVGFL